MDCACASHLSIRPGWLHRQAAPQRCRLLLLATLFEMLTVRRPRRRGLRSKPLVQ